MLKSLYGRFKSFIIIKGYRKELKGIIEHKSLIISRAFILISNMSKTRSIKDNSDLSGVFLKLIVDEELTSQEDELLEVTPKNLRLRKRYLIPHERKKAS